MISPIDELVNELGLNNAPIAAWPRRHECEFLTTLAQAHAKWPTYFNSYADRVLRFANYWSREVREPILGMRQIDRRGSFLGGLPWTSAAYPWPKNRSGQALAPILQLNLAALDTGPLGVHCDVLFQVWAWADNREPFYRSLPLAHTVHDPDWALLPWKASDMYYRFEGFDDAEGWTTPTDPAWFEGRVVGEYVTPSAKWEFSLGRELDNEPDELQLSDSVADDVRKEWGRLEELVEAAPQLSSIYVREDKNEALSGFFGGQMYLQRGGYGDFPEYRTLYSPRENADYGSKHAGLFNWFDGGSDGKLSVLFDPCDHSNLIAVTD